MKSNKLRKSFALSIATVLAVLPNAAFASQPVFKENVTTNSSANSVENYWTATNLANAKSLDIPIPKGNVARPAVSTTGGTSPVSGNGKAPTANITADMKPLFTPQATNSATAGVQPNNVGTAGAHFTSSRVVPQSADVEYPYRTAGKLFFTIPGQGNYVCSASVLRPRIVATAGHCVHGGKSKGFYSNFLFIPSYRDGAAPYGKWAWSWAIVTGEWAGGDGQTVPNAADFAILEVKDQTIGGKVRKIGEVTGYLGYQTQSLIPNHATILGYPGNLDNGEKMHQITAGSFRTASPNSAEYGSDMRGGSSGGPWIQNFGVPATGQTNGLNSGGNRLIGITSYGPTAVGPLYQGSSILNNSFVDILNKACTRKAGNCP
jgi:V8-like Glu-specific endopeptidase